MTDSIVPVRVYVAAMTFAVIKGSLSVWFRGSPAPLP
jgi:hypothetical protein